MNRKIFEPATIGRIDVKNRIIRSATHESVAADGNKITPAMIEMYRHLSEGGVGLIITGFMCVSASDNPSPRTVAIGSDEDIQPLSELADIVHAGGSRIVAQISHVGSQLTAPPSQAVMAPSDVKDPVNGIQPTPFTAEQIRELVKEFGRAALRLKKGGFDGVQIHGAHGYLFSKFLSPVYNRRNDAYGGSPENNVRIIIETIESIKEACGPEFPVWIKLNGSDFGREENSYDINDFFPAATAVAQSGIDAIEVSGGTMTGKQSPSRPKKYEAYHLEFAKQLAEQVNVPVIPVGGFRKLADVEAALAGNDIEAVAMCRPLIREPGLINRWAEGDRSDATCIACNGCFNPTGTRCFFELEGEEKEAQKGVMKMMAALRNNDS